MYAVCLQNLHIVPGNTVLDVGSGSGHFTALSAYLASPGGLAVGLEVNRQALDLAISSVASLKGRGLEIRNLFFEHRNVFLPDLQERHWDRIHVGSPMLLISLLLPAL